MAENFCVVYYLDEFDVITQVNQDWIAFATANGGEALNPPGILGRSLWDFVADETTRLIYRRLFERIRAGRGPVRFSFRCDSPCQRRLLEMSILLQTSRALLVSVRPSLLENRPTVPIKEPHTTDTNSLLRMCAWCQKVSEPKGEWLEIEDALAGLSWFAAPVLPSFTHGICEACTQALTEALDDQDSLQSGSIVLGDWDPNP